MGLESALTALERWPILAAVVAVVVVLAITSKTLDNTPLLRWIGAGFRRIGEREVRRQEAAIEGMRSDIAYLKNRVDDLAHQIAERDTEIRIRDQWIEYAYAYFWRLREFAAEHSIDFPPPPLKSFTEWRRDRSRH